MDGIDISRLRGVRPLPGLNERFWRRVEVIGECWIWRGSRDDYGYGVFSLPVTSERGPANRTERTHRLVYEAINGSPLANQGVLHSCDTPPCLRPLHLRAGSSADNTQDKLARGRTSLTAGAVAHRARIAANVAASIRGREYNVRKLTGEQVMALREAYTEDTSLTAARLAKRYGISKVSTIRIIRGISRKKAGGPLSVIRPREGDRVPNAKLTDEKILSIRTAYAKRGLTMQQLSDRYGVTRGIISQIIRGKTWAHVTGPLKPTGKHHRLTEAEVVEIRHRHRENGTTQAKLAVEYGVSRATVCLLMTRKTHRLT